MIDLPIGKALIAVYSDAQCNCECANEDYQCYIDCCNGCEMNNDALEGLIGEDICGCLCCTPADRKDGKNVIHRLIDYPAST